MDAARIFTVCFLVALSIAATGCATTRSSPREAFLRAHSAERDKYLKLWEVSPEALLRTTDEGYEARRTLVRSLKKDFAKYSDLVERLNAVEARLVEFSKHELAFLEELQREFDPKRDTLLFYVHLDGKHEEDGWMIVRDNQIRKKHVLAIGERNLPE